MTVAAPEMKGEAGEYIGFVVDAEREIDWTKEKAVAGVELSFATDYVVPICRQQCDVANLFCVATIVSPGLLLTAAHCVVGEEDVFFGNYRIPNSSSSRRCGKDAICSDSAVRELDIAGLYVESAVYGGSMEMARIDPFAGSSGGDFPDLVLMTYEAGSTGLKYVPVCNAVPLSRGENLIVEDAEGTVDKGNSGSPLVAFRKDGNRPVVVGVVSASFKGDTDWYVALLPGDYLFPTPEKAGEPPHYDTLVPDDFHNLVSCE